MYELDILQQIKNAGLTIIFHLWKLYLAPSNMFSKQIFESRSFVLVSSSNGKAHKEWEVLEVVDFHQTKRYSIQYKAIYIGN